MNNPFTTMPWYRIHTYFALVITLILAVTLLTPIPAFAAPVTPKSNTTSAIEQPVEPSVAPPISPKEGRANEQALSSDDPITTSERTGNGTKEFKLKLVLDFSTLPADQICQYASSSWARITNDQTGESYWANKITKPSGKQAPVIVDFQKTGVRYPGGSVTVKLYNQLANGYKCTDVNYGTKPDINTLVSYHTEKINIGWNKPEILDVRSAPTGVGGGTFMLVTFSPSWESDFGTDLSLDAVRTYIITDHGKSSMTVKPTTGTSCYRSTGIARNTCFYATSLAENEILGAASLPDNIPSTASTTWPPKDAISYSIGVPRISGPANNPEITQGGPSESAQCARLCAGDPIDTYSGNFFERKSDLAIPGRIGIALNRNYSVGNVTRAGAFGNGWALGYDMSIEGTATSSKVTVIEPSGNRSAFNRASGKYTPASGLLQAGLTKTDTGWEFKRWNENITHVFDTDGKLISIRDNNGNTVTLTYDGGKISRVTEDNHHIDLTWNDNRLVSATDHTGRTVNYQYDDTQRLISRTNPMGGVASYTYDNKHRVTTMTFEDGGVATNTYDDSNRVVKQTLPSGQMLDIAYGAESNYERSNTVTSGDIVKAYTYVNGRIIKFTDSSDPLVESASTYDNKGRLRSHIYTQGTPKQDLLNYDDAGNLTRKEDTRSGAVESFEWNEGRQLTAHVQPTGVRSENSYDTAGNLTATTVIPTDGSASRTTEYTLSPLGEPATITNPLGGVTTLEHSPAGELLSTTDPVGGITSYEYDPLSRVVKTVSAGGNVTGLSASAKAKFTELVSYDLNGNATKVANQSGVTKYSYDPLGQPVSVTDPRGKVKTVEYDPAGKPTTVNHPDNSTDTFTYDPNTGLRTSWTDPQGLTTSYNHQNGVSTTTQPDGTTTSLKQIIGKLDTTIELTDAEHPNGVAVRKDTALNSEVYPTGDGATKTSSSTRNSAGQTTSDFADGIAVDYAYNGFGELAGQTGADRNVAYGYDPAGNINSITYPDGTSVSRELDAAGRITKITDWKGVVYTLGYNPAGQIASMVSSSGLSYVQEHDGALTTSKVWKDSLGAVLASFENTHEASGLLASDSKQLSTDPADVRDFEWNNNGALAKIGNQPVTWDGRLMTNTGSLTLNYDAATSRVTSATGAGVERSYSYDSTGNRISASSGTETTEYQWDLLGKLTALGSTSYSYGNDGLRTSVNDKQQVYDQGLKLLTDGSAKYLWGPDGSLLAQDALVGSLTPGVAGEAITDTMGSVYSLVTQENGAFAALAQYSYTAFGERTLTSGANVSAMGFTSEQHDDSGLIYLRFRYMDPQIGQFISVDPLVGSTLDPYGYASGNPLQMVDPLGLWSWEDTNNAVSGIGSTASWIGLGATILAFTPLGAPILGILVATITVATIVSVATGIYGTTATCSPDWATPKCAASALGTAASAFSLTKPFKTAFNIGTNSSDSLSAPMKTAVSMYTGLFTGLDAFANNCMK